jgi:hypothetical protein
MNTVALLHMQAGTYCVVGMYKASVGKVIRMSWDGSGSRDGSLGVRVPTSTKSGSTAWGFERP